MNMIELEESKRGIIAKTKAVTTRESQILQMISQGFTVKEIASSLFLSEHTVISHKKNLTAKLSAKNCVDLIVKAIKMGLIIL